MMHINRRKFILMCGSYAGKTGGGVKEERLACLRKQTRFGGPSACSTHSLSGAAPHVTANLSQKICGGMDDDTECFDALKR